MICDQSPISPKLLENCLDDGLQPSDWLHLLNSRVSYCTAFQASTLWLFFKFDSACASQVSFTMRTTGVLLANTRFSGQTPQSTNKEEATRRAAGV